MRIIRLAEFVKLPAGTLYARGVEWSFGGLTIKGETLSSGTSWWACDPCWVDGEGFDDSFSAMWRGLETGESLTAEHYYSREDCWAPDEIEAARFMVFERAELLQMQDAVQTALDLEGEE